MTVKVHLPQQIYQHYVAVTKKKMVYANFQRARLHFAQMKNTLQNSHELSTSAGYLDSQQARLFSGITK